MSKKDQHRGDWVALLAYLAFLRAMKPQQNPSVRVLLWLIAVVGAVLGIVALVAAGAPDKVGELVRFWPFAP